MNKQLIASACGFMSFMLGEEEPVLNHTQYGNTESEYDRYWFDHNFYCGWQSACRTHKQYVEMGEMESMIMLYMIDEALYGFDH